MESLLVLLGLALLAVPVAVIYLLVVVAGLKARVVQMSEQLDRLQQRAVQPTLAPESKPTAKAEPTVSANQPEISAPPAPGPWVGLPSEGTQSPASVPPPVSPPRTPSVMARRLADLGAWLQENWFYAAAALSLALSGIFLVQYGIDNGLLPPEARVAAAMAFGAVLISAGEWIRRRFGDSEESHSAYLPSVLSGAGLVSLFGGVLAARMLYGLIGAETALVGLFAIALGGLVLGWFHGPLLAAVGLIGGMGAPFVVGGTSDNPQWLLLYFALLSALGLGIDTLRRWAWVSVLSVALGFGAGWLLVAGAYMTPGMATYFAGYAALLALLATLIPARGLWPNHDGPCPLEAAVKRGAWPIFPVLLSSGSLVAASGIIALSAQDSLASFWIALTLAASLGALFILWSRGAPALQDHALWPALAVLAIVGTDLNSQALDALRAAYEQAQTQTEARLPWDITWIMAAGAVLSGLSAWRSLTCKNNALAHAIAASLFAPVLGLTLEMVWTPSEAIGAYSWALHALALAAGMTLLAQRFAQADGADKIRTSVAVLSALSCIAFALGVVLTQSALTLALGATVVAAAALDRRFDLPLMGAYIAAGVIAIGYRLTVDPGLDWATQAPVLEMLLTYGGSCAAFLAGLALLHEMQRPRSQLFLESAAWSTGGMTLSLTLYHVIAAFAPDTSAQSHWSLGLHATIWAGIALAQLERRSLGGQLRILRLALSALFGLFALAALAGAIALNPLTHESAVIGVPLLNSLAPAYLLPALVLGLGLWRIAALPKSLVRALGGISLALAAFWGGLALRHFWRGTAQMTYETGVTQPELYTYTVALLLLGGLLFYQALARHSDMLRRAGVVMIGLAVAKVFLIDISGLSGLVRVFSFLLLGLSLAGLAWVNRWVQSRAAPSEPERSA